jgi:hypothetical protein
MRISDKIKENVFKNHILLTPSTFTDWNFEYVRFLWDLGYKREELAKGISVILRTDTQYMHHVFGWLTTFLVEKKDDKYLYSIIKPSLDNYLGKYLNYSFLNLRNVLEIYRVHNMPKSTKENFLHNLKNNLLGTRESKEIYDFLVEYYYDESVLNALAYNLRFSTQYPYYVVNLLVNAEHLNDFSLSVILQELKTNMRDMTKLKSLLRILNRGELPQEILDVVRFIHENISDVEVKSLANIVLSANPKIDRTE